MDLYQEILLQYLKDTYVPIDFPLSHDTAARVVESRAYQALLKIKAILEREELDDRECFQRIDEVVSAFESIGAGVEYRHDF